MIILISIAIILSLLYNVYAMVMVPTLQSEIVILKEEIRTLRFTKGRK